jgi:peptide/nickel transport system permease protein
MTAVTAPTEEIVITQRNPLAEIWRNLRRSTSGVIGLLLVALHLLLALLSPMLVPYNPTEMNAEVMLAPPSAHHLFGADELGRDMLSRTLMGGRVAIVVTLAATVLAVVWGGLAGILLGFAGGWLDEVLMRLVDAFLAIPEMLFLLLIASMLGTESLVLILALGFLYGIAIIRMARASTLDFVAQDFILAARARGESWRTIILQELLPNVLDTLLVQGGIIWSWMLISFSALSFLGFGVTPPTPDWGLMVAQNRNTLATAPWATLFPILALSSLIIGANLLVGSLAKAMGLDRLQEVF